MIQNSEQLGLTAAVYHTGLSSTFGHYITLVYKNGNYFMLDDNNIVLNKYYHHIRYNDWVLARFDCPPGGFIAHGSVFHPVLLIYKVKEPNAEKSTGCCIECDASDTEFMIQCDLCLGWYHYVCANVDNCSQATLEHMKFLCSKCQPDKKRKKI